MSNVCFFQFHSNQTYEVEILMLIWLSHSTHNTILAMFLLHKRLSDIKTVFLAKT